MNGAAMQLETLHFIIQHGDLEALHVPHSC